jgi:hypothetical protein
MKLMKDNEEISSLDALKIFTTLMIQHTSKSRSTIDTKTHIGTITLPDGTTYERTAFSAERMYNYFLDLCGDGLFFLNKEAPEFPNVSDDVLNATEAVAPDMEKAEELALKQINNIDKLVNLLPYGIEEIKAAIATKASDTEEAGGWYGPDDYDSDEYYGEEDYIPFEDEGFVA